jgi:hypothetical protein
MYLALFNKNTHLEINSQRIATPVSRFLPGKRHAALIIVPNIYLCVFHTEALLMASNTSYHKRLYDLYRLTYHILALFTTYKHLAVLAHDLGREDNILLYFI